ncbi:hypothetical protein HDU67_008897 [Dinochytrium kinnereticum]|nr:hypothetical protein HDU67_008897 [Dinochytrium kinnereticum]
MDWKSLLVRHPTLFEGATWRSEALAAAETKADGGAQPGPRRIMVIRDSDLIVAVPVLASELKQTAQSSNTAGKDEEVFTVIRMLNLSAWKRACLKYADPEDIDMVADEVGFQELSLSLPINFEARQLCLNENGRLLAIVGDHDIAVAVMPLYSKHMGHDVEVKSYLVGKMHHSFDDITRIAKVSWHPMSEGKAHLMVLSSNGMFRMYNLGKNPDEPEVSFSFCELESFGVESLRSSPKRNNKAGMFSSDYEDLEAVSFDVGTGVGWGPFTVYCLMKSGSIYAACPIVPERCEVSCEQLRSLKSSIQYFWKRSKEDEEYTERQFYWRNHWIEDILVAAEEKGQSRDPTGSSSDESSSGRPPSRLELPSDIVAITVPKTTRNLQIARQGPLRINLPESSDDDFACDFTIIGGELLPVACVAYESGNIFLCVEGEEVQARWVVQRERPASDLEPQFLVYEAVDVSLNKPGRITLEKNSIDPDSIFASHKQGLHFINTRPWRDFLLKAPDVEKALDELLKNHKKSEFRWLLNTVSLNSSSSTVVGFALVTNLYLEYNYIAVTDSGQLHSDSLLARPTEGTKKSASELGGVPPHTAIMPLKSAIPSTPKTPRQPLYIPLITDPFIIPEAIAKSGSSLPHSLAPSSSAGSKTKFPEMIDESSIKLFSKRAGAFREEVADVFIAGHTLEHRISDLVKEEHSHEVAVGQLKRLMEASSTRAAKLSERAHEVHRKQMEIKTRVETLLQILFDASQPQLTSAEVQWIHELTVLKAKVKAFYNPSIRQLEKRKQLLLPDMQAANRKQKDLSAQSNAGGLSSGQMKRAHEALDMESRLLTDASKRCEELRLMVQDLKL